MSKIYDVIKKMLLDLTVEAKKNKLDFLVIKGIALDHYIYNDCEIRQFNDLDILIDENDAKTFHAMLIKMGFKQKLGPSSTNNSSYAKAFAAFNATRKNFDTVAGNDFPVKVHQWKPEFKPYCKGGLPNLEVHDGIYHISKELISEMIKEAVTVCCSNKPLRYKTLNPEHTFIVVLINTYQNSETFFSNAYDFNITVRDYEDIRGFLKERSETVDWDKVYILLEKYKLLDRAGIVLNNLNEIFGEDLAAEQLPGIMRRPSKWGAGINVRMNDTALSRAVSLNKQRAEWQVEGEKHVYKIERFRKDMDSSKFEPCNLLPDTKYRIGQKEKELVFSWYIPHYRYDDGDEFLYQFRLFPLDEKCEYTSYKIDYAVYDGVYRAYGRQTKSHNLGAIKKESNTCLNIRETKGKDMVLVDIFVPIEVLKLDGSFWNNTCCFAADIYRKHWREYYHNIDDDSVMPRVRMMVPDR